MEFNCNTSTSGETTRIVLSGNISERGAEELKSQFRAITGPTKIIVLDMAGVSHIGSAGIGKLLLMYKDLAASGGQIRIENIPQRIYEMFLELKLDSLFTLTSK